MTGAEVDAWLDALIKVATLIAFVYTAYLSSRNHTAIKSNTKEIQDVKANTNGLVATLRAQDKIVDMAAGRAQAEAEQRVKDKP